MTDYNYTVSCIIPTCGRNEFLIDAVNSVLEQKSDYVNEIIIVNNHCNSLSKNEIGLNYSNVVIYNTLPYCGVSQARNFGASVATGDIISFLDDDDIWPSNYIEEVIKSHNSGADFTIARLDKYKNNTISDYKCILEMDLNKDTLYIRNPGVTGSNITLKKELFYKLKGFDVTLKTSEDKDLLIKAINYKSSISLLPHVSVLHRVHGSTRLSNYSSLIIGMSSFYSKYKPDMSIKIKLSFKKKYFKLKMKKILSQLKN